MAEQENTSRDSNPEGDGTLHFHCCLDTRPGLVGGHRSGSMHLRSADHLVTVSDNDGNEVGQLCACIGGGIEFRDAADPKRTWFVDSRDLWNAFQDFRAKHVDALTGA